MARRGVAAPSGTTGQQDGPTLEAGPACIGAREAEDDGHPSESNAVDGGTAQGRSGTTFNVYYARLVLLCCGASQDRILQFTHFISMVSATAATFAALVCLAVAVSADWQEHSLRTLAAHGIMGMAAAQCALIAAADLGWHRVMQLVPILSYWVGRGILLVATVVLMQGACIDIESRGLRHLLDLMCAVLTSSGCFHIIGGMLCLGPLQRWRQRVADRRDQALQELLAIESRKKELEALIV